MSEEHGVVVVAALISCTKENISIVKEQRWKSVWDTCFLSLSHSHIILCWSVKCHTTVSDGFLRHFMNKRTTATCQTQIYLRSSPTWSISHNIRVSSMAQRPKGHSCLSSRLLFSRTICHKWDDMLGVTDFSTPVRWATSRLRQKTNPDVCVLVNLGEVQHVVQSQHPRRSLGEVHGWVHMVLHLKQK